MFSQVFVCPPGGRVDPPLEAEYPPNPPKTCPCDIWLLKLCSHGTIATAIYFLQVMNLWDLVLLS